MAQNDFSAESPNNYEQKSICCLVVDVSSSMAETPIDSLNKALQEFHGQISNDSTISNLLEVAIVTFSDTVDVIQQPALISNFTMPLLSTKGSTKMVDGVREAVRLVESRKNWFKQTGQPHLRPWIVLITDGSPDEDQDVNALVNEIEQGTKSKKYVFLPIGVQNADMTILNKISGYLMDEDSKSWVKTTALPLEGVKFHDFFKWLSDSMEEYVNSKEGDAIKLPDPSGWMRAFKI